VADHPRLSPRVLNRATLDRQLLLRRHEMPAQQAIRHLGGLQAQAPLAPYVGLWTRLARFTTDELSALLSERTVVRAPIMRATVHLADTADFVAFRPLFGPLMAAGLRANYARTLAGVDLDALAAQAAGLLARRPLTRAQLARDLAAAWPAAEPMSLAYAVTYLVPVVQVPPRGIWGKNSQATWTTAESWLAEPIGPPKPGVVEALVLRYLAAFGPATVADIQTWSGLSRLREVTDRLDLRAYRGPDGAELLDLPDQELPAEDTPAPPRFLPEYDNLLLSHADRRRVIPHAHPVPLWPGNGATQGTLLVDGVWDAIWKITAEALTITPFRRLTAAEESAIADEAAKLLTFTSPANPARSIRFSPELSCRLRPRIRCQTRHDLPAAASGAGGLFPEQLFHRRRHGGLEVQQLRPVRGDGDGGHLLVQAADLRIEVVPGLPWQGTVRGLQVAAGHAVDGFERGPAPDQQHARRRPHHVDRDRDSPVGLQGGDLGRVGDCPHQEASAIPQIPDRDHPRRPVRCRVRQVEYALVAQQLPRDRQLHHLRGISHEESPLSPGTPTPQ
jgi:winged helix DNA-binding protein